MIAHTVLFHKYINRYSSGASKCLQNTAYTNKYNTYIANVSSIIYKTILEISNIVHGNCMYKPFTCDQMDKSHLWIEIKKRESQINM